MATGVARRSQHARSGSGTDPLPVAAAMSLATTIIRRTDFARGHYQIVGFDVDDHEAAEIVAEGRAEYDEVGVPGSVVPPPRRRDPRIHLCRGLDADHRR